MRRLSKATKLFVQQLEELPRPESISKTKWRGVKALLIAIGTHYPKAYPSQETLADETGYSVRAIRGYVATAREAGLLLVIADAGRKGANNSWSKTNWYLINIEANRASMDEAHRAFKPYGLRPTGRELRSSLSDERESLSVAASRLDPADRERQVGPAPEPPRRSKMARPKMARPKQSVDELVVDSGRRQPRRQPRQSAVKWAMATEHFAQAWQAMIETLPANDPLRQVRPVETRGHCKSYFDSQFFGPNALTPKSVDDVVILIDQFVDAVKRRVIRFKDEQSAWMAFTGAWGRKGGYLNMNQAAAANAAYVPPQRRK